MLLDGTIELTAIFYYVLYVIFTFCFPVKFASSKNRQFSVLLKNLNIFHFFFSDSKTRSKKENR